MRSNIILLCFASALAFAGCASSQKASVYQTGQVQSKMRVTLATVVDVRDVDIEARPTGAGTSAGVAAGAVAGTAASGNLRGAIVGGVAGAVVGGVVGTVAEKALNGKQGIEIIYQPDNSSETLALVQEKDDTNAIGVGDRIRIIEGQFNVRAVRLPGKS